VAIDPAPFRGVLPLPFSALKSASPVLGNPANRNRAIPSWPGAGDGARTRNFNLGKVTVRF
jgi:hypothetical protein